MKKVAALFFFFALCFCPVIAAGPNARAFEVPFRKIVRKPVESEGITSIGYSRVAKILEIEFRNGRIYQYAGVSEWTRRKFMSAESKGMFFQAEIRGHYAYRRMR